MQLDPKIKKLAIDVAAGRVDTVNFSIENMEDTLRAHMSQLICDGAGKINYYQWEANKSIVFELIATMLDEVTPRTSREVFAPFAEIKTFNEGDKPRFTTKLGKNNVKRFITKVAAAGVYERVRLDKTFVDVDTYAHGGAVYQTLEGFLSGRESVSEVLTIMLAGLQDAIYDDLAVALAGTFASLPTANKHTAAGFVQTEFDRILNTVRAYGTPIILCTQEFAGDIIPASGFVSDVDRNDLRNQGYIGRYMGADVVILPQSFTDATNTVKTIDAQFCYIIPSGAFEKPVKIAYEGTTLIRQIENADWSVEIQLYKKIGLAIVHTNHYGIYKNTNLA